MTTIPERHIWHVCLFSHLSKWMLTSWWKIYLLDNTEIWLLEVDFPCITFQIYVQLRTCKFTSWTCKVWRSGFSMHHLFRDGWLVWIFLKPHHNFHRNKNISLPLGQHSDTELVSWWSHHNFHKKKLVILDLYKINIVKV